jgi:glycosyltransferase involved in cell wall biosynthesis
MTTPVVSVVIPAHNEEAVLGRGIERILAGIAPLELDLVVVANACTDRTAEIARGFGARVIETSIEGKANALRLGDPACLWFPRLYIDADVEVTGEAVRELVSTLSRPGVLACAPEPAWDLPGVPSIVRRVLLVHEALVGSRRGLAGAGVYGLSAEGHARVFPLPNVVADDEWANRMFHRSERIVVREARSVVRPPRSLGAYLRRRVRVRLGNRQLVALGLPSADGYLELDALCSLVASRSVGPLDAFCYLGMKIAERVLARHAASRKGPIDWARDERSNIHSGQS